MPTTWSDLPNEIRKMIVDYIVANKVVCFVRGRRARHQAASRQKGPRRTTKPYHSLLLVSKSFLTSADVTDTVIKHATIKYAKGRDLMALKSSFGPIGFGHIKRLHILAYHWSQWELIKIPPKVLERLESLGRITVSGRTADVDSVCLRCDPETLVEVAKGRCSDVAEMDRIAVQMTTILEAMTGRCIARRLLHPFEFLNQAPERLVEPVIQYEFLWWHEKREYRKIMEFSSSHLCCRLLEDPTVMFP